MARSADELKSRFISFATRFDRTQAMQLLSIRPEKLAQWLGEDPYFAGRLAAAESQDDVPDFAAFRLRFFGRETPLHHKLMVSALLGASPDSFTLILAFPEAAKSSLLMDWVCWRVAQDPNWRTAVITEGQDLARKLIAQVAARMTDERIAPEFMAAFGPFKSDDRSTPWNADFLKVLRASADEKEPTLEARGAGSTLYGGRYDEVVLDDLQSDRSLSSTPALLTYVRQTVLSRLSAGVGRTVGIGSRVGVSDIWERLIDEQVVDHLVSIPALVQPGTLEAALIPPEEMFVRRRVEGRQVIELVEGVDERCASAWPEHWPLERLAARRAKVGEEVWNRTYLQRRFTAQGMAFPLEVVEGSLDDRLARGQKPMGAEVWCGLDPGFDGGTCAFVAVAGESDRLSVIDALPQRGLGTTEEILDLVEAWSQRLRPTTWIVEINAAQRGLARDARFDALAQRFGFAIVPHITHRNKHDAVLGVRQMGTAFALGEVRIAWGDQAAVDVMRPLCEQLWSWVPSKSGVELTQDLVMALWFCWRQWEEERRTWDLQLPNLVRPSWMRAS